MGNPKKIGQISHREYNWLKQFQNLTLEEKAKIDEYEIAKAPKPKPKKLVQPKKEPIEITNGLLWNMFKKAFKAETGSDFIENKATLSNIEPIIKYFSGDTTFKECKALRSDLSKPSFKKGLLIVGFFGNGKSSIMKVLSKSMRYYRMPIQFGFYNMHDLVIKYETLGSAEKSAEADKRHFYDMICDKYPICLDDVKKERIANYYGKANLVKDIIEKRYDKNARTYITCNYRENDTEGNIDDALIEFGEKYGSHIYDRLFEMFNIIQFTGKSYRK